MSICLITGSNGGIGSGVAEHLIKEGWRDIALQYRSDNSTIVPILKRYDLNPEKHLFQAELTDEASVSSLNKLISERLGPVSKLVNIAGGSTNGMSWKLSLSEFRKVLDMNLTSTFLTCREFSPKMREQGFGRIINTSSVVAFSGAVGASHYGAAKAAVAGFSKALSLELVNKNITVNTLALGYFSAGLITDVPETLRTEIQSKIPAKRFGEPSEVGSLVKFILSESAGYITGQTFHLNGGLL